jgi:coenzyme PQQ synthesis protein D (PqqD)
MSETQAASVAQGILRPVASAMGAMIQDEMVIFENDRDSFYGLRGAGRRIWTLIAEDAHTAEDIVQRLCDEFDGDEALIRQDVAQTIAKLSDHGLIEAH